MKILIGSVNDLISFNLVQTIGPHLGFHWWQVTDFNLILKSSSKVKNHSCFKKNPLNYRVTNRIITLISVKRSSYMHLEMTELYIYAIEQH